MATIYKEQQKFNFQRESQDACSRTNLTFT